MPVSKQFFVFNDKTLPFLSFIEANADEITIFDDDYVAMCKKAKAKVSMSDFAEHIANRYSYDYPKFIDAVLLLLGIEDDAVDYISDKYLNTVH